ncbi:unnamed protein product [Musa textilis]
MSFRTNPIMYFIDYWSRSLWWLQDQYKNIKYNLKYPINDKTFIVIHIS